MSNFEIYAQSIDDATLTINTITEDSNFPLTNMQDRNKNTVFKAGNANTSGYIEIDLGSNRTIDYIVLGNHNYTSTSVGIKVSRCVDSDGNFTPEGFVLGNGGYHDYVSGNSGIWFETLTSNASQYWRIYLEAMGAATYQQIGTIFMGTQWNWAHEPELTLLEDSGYNVTLNESAGGSRYSQIANTTVRRIWNIPLEYIIAAEKIKHETFRDQIFPDSRGGLSRYPYYWSDDNGTTLYYSRYRGSLHLEQQAYQVWKANHVFVEEL